MGSVATPVLANFPTQLASTYKANIDAGFAAASRLAWSFAPYADVSHSFGPSEVDTAGDKISVIGHLLINDDVVRFTTDGAFPGGLAAGVDHHVINRTADDFQVSLTQGGAAIDITSGGTGNHTVTRTADMTIRLDAGAIFDGTTLTELAIQKTGTITAPSTNPRIDRVVVDRATGTQSVITGTENASPVAPAITSGKVAVAQIALVVSQSSIVNADITDERALGVLGLKGGALEDVGTGANQLVQLDGSSKLPAIDGSQLTGVSDVVAQNNILLNAFRIAINGGLSVLNMQDGLVDEFEDETGVDTGASTNESYNAADDFYTPTGGAQAVAQGAGTAIGDMTDGAGLSAAFDSDTTQTRLNSTRKANVALAHVGKDWGGGTTRIISGIKLYGSTDAGFQELANETVTFTLQGSTDNFSASTVDLGNGSMTDANSAIFDKQSGFNETTAYRYHRVKITTPGTNGDLICAELEFTEFIAFDDMTLIANAVTAEAVPAAARIVLFEEDVDAVTVNTDLKAYVSRDGGTTYTQITLADEGDYETGKRILAGTVDISGQPSGTSMKWKVETLNAKELKIHGVALQWS